MAKVYNWQIGREMDYPYEEARPAKQFAMVMDTNKCIACQTCTVACKTTWTPGRGQEYMFWNNVETKPYGYYPLGWDVNIYSPDTACRTLRTSRTRARHCSTPHRKANA